MSLRVAVACAALALVTASAAAQSPAPSAVLHSVSLSADTISFGDAFELTLELSRPSASVLLVPERVPGSGSVEGAGPFVWELVGTESGESVVRVRYPVVGYVTGNAETPELTVGVLPASSGAATDEEPGSTIRPYGPGVGVPPPGPSAELHVIPAQSLWITPLLGPGDVASGLEPRPADDVVGASWNPAILLSAAAFASLLLLVGVSSVRELSTQAAGSGATPLPDVDPIDAARNAALAELDALLAEGLGADGDPVRFYRRSSDAVRRYVEELDRAWGPSFTSSELMESLGGRRRAEAIAALRGEMFGAEVVKFGRDRPDADAAIRHCRTLRAWVAES